MRNSNEILVNNSLNAEKILNLEKATLKAEITNIKEIANLGNIKSRKINSTLTENTGKMKVEDLLTKTLKNNGSIEAANSLNSNLFIK